MKEYIAVLAGNYHQFNQFLEENGGTDSEYKYISREHDVYGIKIKEYIVYGTFYERKDWSNLLEEVERRIATYN